MSLVSSIQQHALSYKLDFTAEPQREKFIANVMQGVKSLGVISPKIPNTNCQAGLKTLSPKLPARDKLPGINAFSVPVRQQYDWAGGMRSHFSAFTFLVTPFLHEEKWRAIANLDSDTEAAMTEILGEDWEFCAQAMRDHFSRHVQYPLLMKCERQIFFVIDKEKEHSLIVSPMADTLHVELALRLEERKQRKQYFNTISYPISSNDYSAVGVAAANVNGRLTRLLSLPFEQPHRQPQPLPESEPGSFLVLELVVKDLNVTGAGIVSGLANLTNPVGFAEALRRKLFRSVNADLNNEFNIDKLAVGFSNASFFGKQMSRETKVWEYIERKGVYPGDEAQAATTVHLVMQLNVQLAPNFLSQIRQVLAELGYGGGKIVQSQVALTQSPEIFFKAWGKDVWFLENKQSDIADADDKLDAALDRISKDARYALASAGYQAIEPPRPRNGLRDPTCKHVFATNIASLVHWTSANVITEESRVFWQSAWTKATYSATVE